MKRQSVYLPELGHKNPIPAACRIGNMVATGIVYGLDPATGQPAATLDEQCRILVDNPARLLGFFILT